MSPVYQDLAGFWRHTESSELFESEADAMDDYERQIRSRV